VIFPYNERSVRLAEHLGESYESDFHLEGHRLLMKQDPEEGARQDRARQIQESIRAVLLHDWDPIGIQDEPGAQDEYDSYVGGVYRLLASGASEEEIVEHLWQIETVTMGLSTRDRTKLLPGARRLLGLDVTL
jgi:hypothetical protein